MNYTPERADGGIDLARALEINVQFDLSRQFWAHLVTSEKIPDPTCFIRPCPHLSFVSGADNVTFLKKRHAAMASTHKWQGMEYNEDPAVLVDWAPLLMARRDTSEPIAATRMVTGSDVDYGTLTRILVDHLNHGANVAVLYNTEVQDLTRGAEGLWRVETRPHEADGDHGEVRARRVFVGAGGGSLPLLQKSGIPEGHGYGGFPISGNWLRCDNPAVVERHRVKVYGKAAHGSPPMSMPHLDTRVVNGRHSTLFGPYAGFSPAFLKEGSYLDLFRSVRLSNLGPLIDVAVTTSSWRNISPTRSSCRMKGAWRRSGPSILTQIRTTGARRPRASASRSSSLTAMVAASSNSAPNWWSPPTGACSS